MLVASSSFPRVSTSVPRGRKHSAGSIDGIIAGITTSIDGIITSIDGIIGIIAGIIASNDGIIDGIIDIELRCDYLKDKEEFDKLAKKTIYTKVILD